jgi:predicted RNase H-like HicB family nuclease
MRPFTASITHEDDWVIAQCVEVDIASQGETEEAALQNLGEAIALYFTSPVTTPLPVLRSVEVEFDTA